MARRRSERMIVTRVDVDPNGGSRRVNRRPDELIVEEPMSIQLDGTPERLESNFQQGLKHLPVAWEVST